MVDKNEEAARWFAASRRGVMLHDERADYERWRGEPENAARLAELQAIWQGLEMPLGERQERYRRMFAQLAVNDVDHWADQFLRALEAARLRPTLLGGLRQLFALPTAPTV